MILRKQKGQATLETVVVSMTFLLFISLLLSLLYFGVVYTNLRFTSHELLICPEYQESPICFRNFNLSLKQMIRFGKIQDMRWNDSVSQRKISFRLKLRILNLKNVELFYQDQVQLPLRKGS